MKSAMKHRLVGTIVIGCLAIIFIPILLDGEGVTPPALNTNIPQAPTMPTVPDINPVRPEITADSTPVVDTVDTVEATDPVPEESGQTADNGTAAPPTPERPRLTAAGVPETWTVRLGSFGEAVNAEALVERLRNNGYKGFSRPLQTSRGTLTGVYVGPVLTQADAVSLQQELARAFELEGVVVQFSIEALEE